MPITSTFSFTQQVLGLVDLRSLFLIGMSAGCATVFGECVQKILEKKVCRFQFGLSLRRENFLGTPCILSNTPVGDNDRSDHSSHLVQFKFDSK